MADWDERYRSGNFGSLETNPLLERAIRDLPPGRALDLACGAGRHALFLAAAGWNVTAVDRSRAGIDLLQSRARERGLMIDTQVTDLERGEFHLAADSYDLICDFYYLQHNFFAEMRTALRVGGVLVAAIHLAGEGADGKVPKHSYVLEPRELRTYFEDWEILHYHETTGIDTDAGQHHQRTAELIAKRPSS